MWDMSILEEQLRFIVEQLYIRSKGILLCGALKYSCQLERNGCKRLANSCLPLSFKWTCFLVNILDSTGITSTNLTLSPRRPRSLKYSFTSLILWFMELSFFRGGMELTIIFVRGQRGVARQRASVNVRFHVVPHFHTWFLTRFWMVILKMQNKQSNISFVSLDFVSKVFGNCHVARGSIVVCGMGEISL